MEQDAGSAGEYHRSELHPMLPANWEPGGGRLVLSLFLSLGAGEILHLILIDFDLSRLLQLGAEIIQKKAEDFLLFAQEQRVTDLIFLGLKSCALAPAFPTTPSTTPVVPLLMGPLISPGFMVKATAAPPAMEPMSGT